jgi:hypothetical protein
MRAWVDLADRAERSPVVQELRYAARDGVYFGWVVALVAGVATWGARGMPSPVTAGGAAGAAVVGTGAAAWRAFRRVRAVRGDAAEGRAAALSAARRWATAYGIAAAVVPPVVTAASGGGAGALVPVVAVASALVVLAVATIPVRARARLLARLRTGAAAVGGDEVRVGRALWIGWTTHIRRVFVTFPADWSGAHRSTRRDELVERTLWELVGPPPRTPDEARARPDYETRWNHVHHRLEVERVPTLPRHLAARDWERPAGALVLGQTTRELADAVVDGVPVALYRPTGHLLVVGATQHGKSSGVRAWAVDALAHGVFPGGCWVADGKGSGSLASLIGRAGVHGVAHEPDGWRAVLGDVAPEVARRYSETLAWRSEQSDRPPAHPRALLILDEVQQILMSAPDLADVLDTLARQALEAGVTLWVITQRPDAKDAVPGAIRDQIVDRATFGPLSGSGAKMSFDMAGDDWHKALGVAPIAGRALTWLGGTWRPVQAPWMPFPVDDATVEPLYPPRVAQRPAEPRPAAPPPPDSEPDATGEQARQEDVPPPPRPRPAPRPAPAPESPGETPPPIPQVQEIMDAYGDEDGPQQRQPDAATAAAYDPTDPYAHRRRRRRD